MGLADTICTAAKSTVHRWPAFGWCLCPLGGRLVEYWNFGRTGLLDAQRYRAATCHRDGRGNFVSSLRWLFKVLSDLLYLRNPLLWFSVTAGCVLGRGRKVDFVVSRNKVLLDLFSLVLDEVARRKWHICQGYRLRGGQSWRRRSFRWRLWNSRRRQSCILFGGRHVLDCRVVALEDDFRQEFAHRLGGNSILRLVVFYGRFGYVVVDLRVCRVSIRCDFIISDGFHLQVCLLVFLQIVQHLHVEVQFDIINKLNRWWLGVGRDRHDIVFDGVIICN